MKLQLTLKHRFYTDEKLFELFCIENNFAKYFANVAIYNAKIYLFECFVSHITVIPRNDTFLYYRTSQISIKLMRQFL